MSLPPTGRILAIDWGARRIGLAISDDTRLVASPLAVLTRRTGRRFPMKQFLDLVAQESPVGLLVGLPLGDDGNEGDAGLAARELGRAAAARTGLPVEWTDESFTTALAQRSARAAGIRVSPDRIDAMAAAALLQRWLDQSR
jgi:putative Holliday junction resolvase